MKTLNIIGAGRVGRTLASLWAGRRALAIQDILSGTAQGAASAAAFICGGRPVARFEVLRTADVWMITTPDRRIRDMCEHVAAAGLLRAGDIVFHCSGSMSSAELAAAAAAGARVASVHPLKTFADPVDAVSTFAPTFCAAEGDAAALDVLVPLFERIGGRVARIDAQHKTLYHGASVMVSNCLIALMETGLRCYEQAGISRETASAMIEPIVQETVRNVFHLGTARALTGPIARGDDAVVARHLDALTAWDPQVAAIYRNLGVVAVELARAQGEAEGKALARIEALLKPKPG